jgi:hypothetical protein
MKLKLRHIAAPYQSLTVASQAQLLMKLIMPTNFYNKNANTDNVYNTIYPGKAHVNGKALD